MEKKSHLSSVNSLVNSSVNSSVESAVESSVTTLREAAEKRIALADQKAQADQKAEAEQNPLADQATMSSELALNDNNANIQTPQAEMLLQELRVHQLELEMQNEALQQAHLEVEESLNRYVNLYEFAPVGYVTLTENGAIAEANLISADLLGENRAALIKKPFSRFIVPEDGDRWHQHFDCVIQKDKTKGCEVRMRRADGSIFYARLDCLLVGDINDNSQTNGLRMRVSLSDISELKLAEQESRVAATVFESQEGMFVTDAKNLILKVNHAFTNITGYSAAEALGKTPQLLHSGRHDAGFYSAMWARIKHTGGWHGEVWNRRKSGDIYPQWLTITAVKGEDGEVMNYVATLTDITARKAAEAEMELLAFYDPLTKLPNRRLLLDRLQHAMNTSARNRQYCALMFVDLDNFKSLNDTMGHDVGDLMLQIVGQRLAICVREGDTVSRVGGDEFMVMLENLHVNAQEAAVLAENIGKKILVAISQPFQLAGQERTTSASIGITLFINHFFTLAEIQKQADLAMYAAKTAGRNVLRFYKQEL